MYKWTDTESIVCIKMIEFHILRYNREQLVSFHSFMDEEDEIKRWKKVGGLLWGSPTG